MKTIVCLALLVLLASAASFAAGSESEYSGYLVDSNCYTSLWNNTASSTTADRDMDLNVKLCVPHPWTKSFGVTQQDWTLVRFGATANEKAAALLNNRVEQRAYVVSIMGNTQNDVLDVDSISILK
jgi:opacity protein-like surface antigen